MTDNSSQHSVSVFSTIFHYPFKGAKSEQDIMQHGVSIEVDPDFPLVF